MRFSTFSVSVLPDIETARHNHNLDGLSDKDVGNVLFHQRKQRTGDSEVLPWHQLRIAAITCIDYNQGEVSLTTQSLETRESTPRNSSPTPKSRYPFDELGRR